MVFNSQSGIIMAETLEKAETFWKRFKGLQGRKRLAAGHALLLKPSNGIHTFFMRFPIDVAFLDAEGQVLYMIESMPPFRLSPVIAKAQVVVEFPAGTLRLTETKVGHQLKIQA